MKWASMSMTVAWLSGTEAMGAACFWNRERLRAEDRRKSSCQSTKMAGEFSSDADFKFDLCQGEQIMDARNTADVSFLVSTFHFEVEEIAEVMKEPFVFRFPQWCLVCMKVSSSYS